MKTVIWANQTGWVVYPSDNIENFHVFLSTEPERFVKFIAEKVARIKVDQLVAGRLAEIEAAKRKLEQ